MISPQKRVTRARNPNLTEAEIAVLRILCQGHTAREAADILCCSERTISFHTDNIHAKWKVRSTIQAYNRAMACGIIRPPRLEDQL